MKKILLALVLFVQISSLRATWFIGKIINRSDLSLVQAVRNDDVEIASISELLKNSGGKTEILFDEKAFFGTQGHCKIIAQDHLGNKIAIAFFGDSTHRVGNGRAPYADYDSRLAASLLHSPMMARVITMQSDSRKLIGYKGYEDDNQFFTITLVGERGNYTADIQ